MAKKSKKRASKVSVKKNYGGISVGGDFTGGAAVIGDKNVVKMKTGNISVQKSKVTLPPPESVDIKSELASLQAILAELQAERQTKIDNAVEEAAEEVQREEPDKDEVGAALERALEYAQKSEGWAGTVEKLKPHLTCAASWLGKNWHKLLGTVGLIV